MFFHPEPALLLFSISKVRFIYLEECIRLHIFIICQIGLFPQFLLIFGNRICHQFIVDSLKSGLLLLTRHFFFIGFRFIRKISIQAF